MEDFIDISEINNCWIGQLLLGSSKNDLEEIKKFQEKCIKDKIFKIGWSIPIEKDKDKKIEKIRVEIKDKFEHRILKNLDEKEIKEFDKLYEKYQFFKNEKNKEKTEEDFQKDYSTNKKNDKGKERESSLEKVLCNMKKMEKNDLIIVRLKSGKYYIGKIEKEAKFSSDKESYNWGVEVHDWVIFKEEDLLGDIVGRFSQRNHPTIQRISEDSIRIKVLVIKLFQEQEKNEGRFKNINIPTIKLNKNNFTYALNYMELEDLVYFYILNKNKGYKLLPSSCKSSKMNYEMNLINVEGKIITCQVKNKRPVFYKDYKTDAEEKIFEKIYLFSGIEEYIDKKALEDGEKEEKEINEKIENEKKKIGEQDLFENENLIIIRKSNLFNFFSNSNNFKYLEDETIENIQIIKDKIKLSNEKYYIFSKEEVVQLPGDWKEINSDKGKMFSQKYKKEYKKEREGVILKNKFIIYSNEFQSWIQCKKIENEEQKNLKEELLRCINIKLKE